MHHARQTLRDRGYRLTPQRNLIWEVLRGAGRHMTAEEVAAEVRRTLPDVNVSTVYRTLELLVSLDLVVETRLEGSACYYEVSPEPTHHHFVCTQVRRRGPLRRRAARAGARGAHAPGLQREPDPGDGLRRCAGSARTSPRRRHGRRRSASPRDPPTTEPGAARSRDEHRRHAHPRRIPRPADLPRPLGRHDPHLGRSRPARSRRRSRPSRSR